MKKKLRTLETEDEKPKNENKHVNGRRNFVESELKVIKKTFDIKITIYHLQENTIFFDKSIKASILTIFDIGLYVIFDGADDILKEYSTNKKKRREEIEETN